MSRSHLAHVVGVSPLGSGFEKNLSTLRTAGLIGYPAGSMVELTDDGASLAHASADITSTRDLLDVLERRLGRSKGPILRELVRIHPTALSREELADVVGVSPNGSGFEKNLSSLRTAGFIDYPAPGMVVALETLLIGGPR